MLSNDLKMQQCIFLNMLFHFHLENKQVYTINIHSFVAVPFLCSSHRQQVGISAICLQSFPRNSMGFFETRRHPFDEIPDLICCLPMCTPSHSEDKIPLISQFPLSHNKLENTVGLHIIIYRQNSVM